MAVTHEWQIIILSVVWFCLSSAKNIQLWKKIKNSLTLALNILIYRLPFPVNINRSHELKLEKVATVMHPELSCSCCHQNAKIFSHHSCS